MPSPLLAPSDEHRERTLRAVCEAAVKLVGVDHSGLVLFDPDRHAGTVIAEYPTGTSPTVGTRIQVSGISPEEKLALQGDPIIIDDLGADLSLGTVRDVLLDLGIRSIVVVPIVVDGKIKGSFSFDSIALIRKFTQLDIDRCQSLAEFASLAIKEAYQLDKLEPLRQAMLAIASAQEREPLLEAITLQAVNLLNADSGGIDEWDEARRELSVIAAHNLPDEIVGQKLMVGQGIAGCLIESDLDYMAQPNYSQWEFRARYRNVDVLESVVGVPLISDEKRTGVLWVNAEKGRIFEQSDIDLLKHLAVFASIALEQSWLRENERYRERSRSERFEKLADATFQILSRLTTDNRKERLTLIAHHAHQIVDAEACGILLVEEPGWLTLAASDGHREGGFDEGRQLEIVTGKGTGLTGHIAKTGTAFREFGAALKNHPAVKNRMSDDISPSEECFSLLAIPLRRRGGDVRGLLRISNKRDKDGSPNELTSFTEDDQSIGEIFAQAALVAIETADLLDKVKLGETRYKMVHEACDVLAKARGIDDGLRGLAEMMVALLGKSFCRIALYNESDESVQVIAAVKNKNCGTVRWNPRLGEKTKVTDWYGLADSLASGEPKVLRVDDDAPPNYLDTLAKWIELRDQDGKPLPIRSMLRIILKEGSQVIGVLNIGEIGSDDFQSADIDQAVAISDQISLLIERLRNDKKLVQDIFKIESEINASNDLEKTLRLVASLVYDVTHRWGRGVTVADVNVRDGNKVRVVAAYPEDRLAEIRKIIGNFDLRVGKNGRIGIVGRVILDRNSMIVADVSEDPDYFPIHSDTRSQLVVPIKDGDGEVLGVISAEGSQLGAFDEQDRVIVEGLASQASSAIGKVKQSRENKKVRTIALVGAAGSIWKHSLKGHADLIQSEVEAALNVLTGPPGVLTGLRRIGERATDVLQFPFTGPLSENQGVSIELLNDVIQERLRRLRAFLKGRGQDASIETDLTASEGIRVRMNRAWFQYALKIFLVNAREAVKETTPRKITLRTEIAGDSLCRIVINNTGPKISDEIWQKLGIEQIERDDGNLERGVGLLIADLILAVYGGKFEKITNEDDNIVMGVMLPISDRE